MHNIPSPPPPPRKADCPSASGSPSSETPETDRASNAWLGNVMIPWDLARKLERDRDRYKAAYDVAIYNLIGVAGYGHPGVNEATNIVNYPEKHDGPWLRPKCKSPENTDPQKNYCGGCGKDEGDSLWGFCSLECLEIIHAKHFPENADVHGPRP